MNNPETRNQKSQSIINNPETRNQKSQSIMNNPETHKQHWAQDTEKRGEKEKY
jgi:hypothetical protein